MAARSPCLSTATAAPVWTTSARRTSPPSSSVVDPARDARRIPLLRPLPARQPAKQHRDLGILVGAPLEPSGVSPRDPPKRHDLGAVAIPTGASSPALRTSIAAVSAPYPVPGYTFTMHVHAAPTSAGASRTQSVLRFSLVATLAYVVDHLCRRTARPLPCAAL